MPSEDMSSHNSVRCLDLREISLRSCPYLHLLVGKKCNKGKVLRIARSRSPIFPSVVLCLIRVDMLPHAPLMGRMQAF
jgi:hypothetical protein